MENKYITGHFLEACRNPQFHHQWMTAETWADIITTHYNVPLELKYNSKSLIEAIHQTKWLASILNTTGQVNEHINVYQKWYRPKNQKQINCFYATPSGEEPKGSNAGKDWFREINLAEDLLNFKKTRSTALHFSSYPETNLSSTSETKKRNAPSSAVKPQPGNLSH